MYEQLFSTVKDSAHLPTLMRVGATFLTSGDPDKALFVYLRATMIEPIPPDAYTGAAVALEALSNPVGALMVVKDGLAYNPIWQPLLERCISLSETLQDSAQRTVCNDRLELLRAIPTWK